MNLGEIYLTSNYSPGTGRIQVNDMTQVLRSSGLVPNQISVFRRGNTSPAAIYSVASAAGGTITGLALISGTDGPFRREDVVLLQVNPSVAASGQIFTFGLAPGPSPGTNLSAGTNLFGGSIATAAKSLSGYIMRAGTNPSGAGGGVTVDIQKNGSSILSSPVAIAAGNTGEVSGVPAIAAVSQGDVFTVNTSSVGTGVQDFKVVLY